MAKFIDLAGQKFHRLTVISRAANGKHGDVRWNCICDCGNNSVSTRFALNSGITKSCGCLRRENAAISGKKNVTHGMTNSKEYKSWCGIIDRCTNQSNPAFNRYGGRGITVCDKWRESFAEFFSNMGKCPPNHSIERIDNNGNYEPGNCKWATAKEQANNRRSSKILKHDGKEMTVSQWCEHLRIGYSTIQSRLFKGWSIEKALSTPVRKHKKYKDR